MRSEFDERLPVDETTTVQDATVGDYLLLHFFQRIPGTEEMPEREAAREIFVRLAAPRVLDRHVIRALLPPYLVGRFPYPCRWPGRNSVRRVAVYLIAVLLVPSELVADLTGERAASVQNG